MNVNKVSKYVFIGLLLVLLYLTFKLVQPFFTYIFLGLILTIALHPLYRWFTQRIKHEKTSSIIVIILILIILIIPSYFIITALVKQSIGLINSFNAASIETINNYVINILGPRADLVANFNNVILAIRDFILKSAPSIAGSVAEMTLGIFIMFFIMYYGFVEGNNWFKQLRIIIPFKKKHGEKLVHEIKNVTQAVIYGQIFISILQGLLGGIGFFIVGIPNPVFWGFIMTILAFLPVIGTGFIWAPAAIIEIANSNYLGGIFLLIYGFFIVSGVDNILRPKIISGKGRIHPIVALIGVLGGLKVFGFLGIIIGPLIAALFITLVGFYYEDYVNKKPKQPNPKTAK
ncbi:MAG: AI-2E family transporter [Nanoarchaeota archaeon]|nr:AI-2E family transporter [Nanoarchaeota archaeon]MBU1322273.1 AI-2E family transporter [Nanoarchaeota archaeon]MBU1598026.1 AI-2E family transporter [Nanoarchaeota archaeon]MBU2441008.1 AI-2E family transporter [Nanoarchaeota archaeon]